MLLKANFREAYGPNAPRGVACRRHRCPSQPGATGGPPAVCLSASALLCTAKLLLSDHQLQRCKSDNARGGLGAALRQKLREGIIGEVMMSKDCARKERYRAAES